MDALQAGLGSEQGQAGVNDLPNFATGGVTIFFAVRREEVRGRRRAPPRFRLARRMRLGRQRRPGGDGADAPAETAAVREPDLAHSWANLD
jgi:hypothetical protein